MIPTYSVIVGGHESGGYLLGPLSLTRGRAGEGSVTPSTLSFTLDNSDGRFTPGGSGAWSADVARGAVVTASANGSLRFTGRVESVALLWPSQVVTQATVTFTCVDAAADWASSPLESLWDEWTRACGPAYWWKLTDDNAPALEFGGNYADRLTAKKTGTGSTYDMLSWGGATGPASDEADSLLIENASSTVGAYLQSATAIDLDPALNRVVVSVVVDATSDGPVLEMTDGEWTHQLEHSSGTYTLHRWSRADDGAISHDTDVLVSGADGTTHVTFAAWARLLRGCAVRVGYGYNVATPPTSRRLLESGAISHLAIFPYPLAFDPPSTAGELVSTKIGYLSAVALGATLTPTMDGFQPTVAHLSTSGATIPEVLSRWADGTGSRWVVDPSGTLVWTGVDGGAWVEVSAEWLSPSVAPVVDGQGHVNTVDLSLPDGGSWTWSTGETPIVRVELAGAFDNDAESRALAQWMTGTPAGIRLPTVEFDLLTIPDAVATTVAYLAPGDRLTITDLPPQMPAATWTGVVEGATETWGPSAWSATYTVSPDNSSGIWTLDDAARGELDAMNRLGFIPYAPAPPAAIVFADDFNRADSTDVGNGWIRYNPELGGGIIDGVLAVVDDYYDWFERPITLPAAWRVEWTITSTAPGPTYYNWLGLELYATEVGGTVATVGFGAGTDGGLPKTVWIDADGKTGVYVLADLPVTGDVVAVMLDADGNLSASVNGTTVATMTASGVPTIGYLGLNMIGTGTGTRLSVDDFTIT